MLIAQSAYATLVDVIKDSVSNMYHLPGFPIGNLVVWFTGRESGRDLFQVRPVDDIGSIAPRPILIIQGTDDPTVGMGHARWLYEAAGEPKTLYIVQGGKHGGFIDLDPVGFEQHLMDFLNTYFPAYAEERIP